MKSQYDTIKKTNTILTNTINNKDSNYDIQKVVLDTNETNMLVLKSKNEVLKKENNQLYNDIKEKDILINRLKSIKNQPKDTKSYKSKCEELQLEIFSLQKTIRSNAKQFKDLSITINEKEMQIQILEDNLAKMGDTNKKYEEDLAEQKVTSSTLQSQINSLSNQLQTIQQHYQKLLQDNKMIVNEYKKICYKTNITPVYLLIYLEY